jgi:hypothetical protein
MSEGGAGGGGAGLVTKKRAFEAGYNDKRWRETPASNLQILLHRVATHNAARHEFGFAEAGFLSKYYLIKSIY